MPEQSTTRKQRRLAALQCQVKRLQTRIESLQMSSERYSRLRLSVFVGGMLLSLAAFYALEIRLGVFIGLVTLVVFTGVVYAHRQIEFTLRRYRLWQQIKRTHVTRMMLDWQHIPPVPDVPPVNYHPYEIDLDITGRRSLYHLLDTSVTHEGSQRLRDWLLMPLPDADQIAGRQAIVQRLKPMSRFRDKLTLQAMLTRSGERIRGQLALEWLAAEAPSKNLQRALWLATVLAGCNIALFALSVSAGLPPLWPISFAFYALLWGRHWQAISTLFETARSLHQTFTRLRTIFRYLETAAQHSALQDVCHAYRRQRPSLYLRRLTQIVAAAGLQQNPFAWFVVNLIIPWDLFWAYQLNRSKTAIAALMPDWLDAWFELEALNSLANFAYLNPDYSFPTITPTFALHAENIGHPLLPDLRKVTNDFTLAGPGQTVIITGSNMAGKSTFLRTLGVNLCLAYAGGPVNASRFETGLFRLYTCIRINDSINDGLSYFYAEVKRLRSLLTELERPHPLPLFFLIDEIFRGTNNRERLLGSREYIRSLVNQNGIGLIATHDLELVRLAEEFPQIANFHFREEVHDGQMVFDYHIRSGPCPTTNALKIMALEGLPVPQNILD